MMRMHRERSQLLVIDMQERLLPHIHQSETVVTNCLRAMRLAKRLDVPIMISEQNPKGIGPTVEVVRDEAGNTATIFEKMHFSCMQDEAIYQHLVRMRDGERFQIVLVGVEAHVCVAQTALHLAAAGYNTFVMADAVSSRTAQSRELALNRMRQAGVIITDIESVAFEWLEKAGTQEFRDLLPMLK
ncbi:MAG: hydrolase [Alphaproteobacteria bacterium]